MFGHKITPDPTRKSAVTPEPTRKAAVEALFPTWEAVTDRYMQSLYKTFWYKDEVPYTSHEIPKPPCAANRPYNHPCRLPKTYVVFNNPKDISLENGETPIGIDEIQASLIRFAQALWKGNSHFFVAGPFYLECGGCKLKEDYVFFELCGVRCQSYYHPARPCPKVVPQIRCASRWEWEFWKEVKTQMAKPGVLGRPDSWEGLTWPNRHGVRPPPGVVGPYI